MSWLFSQALVAEYSAGTCWDGAPSAPLSVMPTQHKFWRNDKMMEPSKLSQFGLTCAVLTEDRGEDLLTWFLEDSLARTYQSPEAEPGSMENSQGFGEKWHESLAKYCLVSSTWKTHQCLWEEDLPWSLVILPKWGMTLNGQLFQQKTAERPISEIGSGLWPTPVRRDYRHPGRSRMERTGSKSGECLPQVVGGPLNPEWVEWLMGWPSGWTELKPLEMDKFREWQQQHSQYLLEDENG